MCAQSGFKSVLLEYSNTRRLLDDQDGNYPLEKSREKPFAIQRDELGHNQRGATPFRIFVSVPEQLIRI
jgi:hypothetical protein